MLRPLSGRLPPGEFFGPFLLAQKACLKFLFVTRKCHPGPIREKWAVRPDEQEERPHVGQRRLGMESAMRSLVLCDSLKKAFKNSYSLLDFSNGLF